MIRILIVEDEKPIAELIRLSLRRAGYHCQCVYDGLEMCIRDRPAPRSTRVTAP